MNERRWAHWMILLIATSLVACGPATSQPQAPTAMPSPPASPTLAASPTSSPTASPTLAPTPTPTLSPPSGPSPSRQPPSEQVPAPPYTSTGDRTTGRIRGGLFFPSEYIPSLAVYAVAADGGRFYRVDTQKVPPGEPSYEIPLVEAGTYHVYAYPAPLPSPAAGATEGEAGRGALLGGTYSYLSACEAGHIPLPPGDCWEDPKHDLAPVEVRAGQAVEEIDIFDWYGPPLPLPPDDTGDWPTHTDEQLAYRIRYPPHWALRSVRQGETTFGPPSLSEEGLPEGVFASVRVTTGDPEELADQLIASLPPGNAVAREWRPFAGRNSLYLALDLPEGRFAWWFVPRYELVYIVHAVTDSGLGSFEQMVESFAFVE